MNDKKAERGLGEKQRRQGNGEIKESRGQASTDCI